MTQDCLGHFVIANRVAHCARRGQVAQEAKSLGHALGSAWVMTLAIVKYA
jgi:hypothetical protein